MMRKNKQGGGVCLYINKPYQFRERLDLIKNVSDVIESQVIEIIAKPNNIVIGIIYRPLNDKVEEFKECLADLLQRIALQNKKMFLSGRF